ncbi:hypothetical protein K0M31_004154, partial [Melipona bicolor]
MMKRSPESPNLARIEPGGANSDQDRSRPSKQEPTTSSKVNVISINPGIYGIPPMPMYGGDYASNNYHQTDLSLPGLGFMDTGYANMMEESYVPHLPFGYQPGYMIRSINPNDLLGFGLSADELEELYHEIGDRMPRNSKNLNKKIFQHVAMKCCPNAQLCYDNPR